MNVLFVSSQLIAADVAWRMKNEGHAVKLFIEDTRRRNCFDQMVEKTDDWRKELDWVGKDGLIVFDDVGYGETQDQLRQEGFAVFGGSAGGDRLELDREYAQNIFASSGMKTVSFRQCSDFHEAITFVESHPRPWVIKQNYHYASGGTYVGVMDDGSDVLAELRLRKAAAAYTGSVFLQERLDGIEIGLARYFNGTDWIGQIEMNVEHKRFFPGDLGPLTSEMGTLAWFTSDENNRLYREMLAPLKPFLREIDFRGDIGINCMINEHGAFPLEATCRFGSPIVHLQSAMCETPWGELLKAAATGKPCDFRYKPGYGIVVLLTAPPFPFTEAPIPGAVSEIPIDLSALNADDWANLYFEEVVARSAPDGFNRYHTAMVAGYLLYATAVADNIVEASNACNVRCAKIKIPDLFYRNDIGHSFAERTAKQLIEWGYFCT